MSIFGTVLTTVVTLLHLYVFWRLDALPVRRKRVNRKLFISSAIVLWGLFFLGRMYGGHESGLLSLALEIAAMHWMASVFLLAVGFFAADLITGFGFLFRRQVPRLRTPGFFGGVAMVAIAHAQGLRPPVVEQHELPVAGLPAALDGVSLVMMSDMHTGEMGLGERWMRARIAQVMALKPDLVVLVGDMFERSTDPATMAPVMRQLRAPLGVYAVRGNHDTYRPNRRDVAGEILREAGIRLLQNEWVQPAEGLVLAGIDDLTSSRRNGSAGEAYLDSALTGRPDLPTILLSHTPWLTERVTAAGVELMLSGHTHNGQIWPFTYLVRHQYPHVGGRYQLEGTILIVGRGTGTWGPRMRLWLPGEITLVRLRAK
jgi:uncharacterized protein